MNRRGWYNRALMSDAKSGVFISHIGEEKPVALALREHLQLVFGTAFPVFVSSHPRAIGGGRPWFDYIIENLRTRRVVLVLVSQESRKREWINFEAGFGNGAGARVIPVMIKNVSPVKLPFPLAGFQARSLDALEDIVSDISEATGYSAQPYDIDAYRNDIQMAEASLQYKSLVVTPVSKGSALVFDLQNVGNVDLELLMLEVYLPAAIKDRTWTPGAAQHLDFELVKRGYEEYAWFACYSNRGVYGSLVPILRPVITPSMGCVRVKGFSIRLIENPGSGEMAKHIYVHAHAVGYDSEEQQTSLGAAKTEIF